MPYTLRSPKNAFERQLVARASDVLDRGAKDTRFCNFVLTDEAPIETSELVFTVDRSPVGQILGNEIVPVTLRGIRLVMLFSPSVQMIAEEMRATIGDVK